MRKTAFLTFLILIATTLAGAFPASADNGAARHAPTMDELLTIKSIGGALISREIQSETEWVKFTAPKGLFSLQSPLELKLEEPADAKAEEPPHSRFNAFGDGYGFVIEYFEGLKIGDPEKYLDVTRDGVVNAIKGTLTSQDKVTLDGYPGREVSLLITAENGTVLLVRTRIYLVGTSMFSISYIWRKDGDPVVRAKMGEKFFSSVRIKPNE